jgi:hypothetical protein
LLQGLQPERGNVMAAVMAAVMVAGMAAHPTQVPSLLPSVAAAKPSQCCALNAAEQKMPQM